MAEKKSISRGSTHHMASGTIEGRLLTSNAELRLIKDELDLAIGDVNSSGLLSKGILDEAKN